MSVAYLSNAEGNAWLQANLTARTCWLALHTAEPTPAADPSSEVLGDGYERQRIIFGPPSAKSVTSTNNQTFDGMPAATITWMSVWSAQFSGRMIVAIQLDTPQVTLEGYQFLGAAGDVTVSV